MKRHAYDEGFRDETDEIGEYGLTRDDYYRRSNARRRPYTDGPMSLHRITVQNPNGEGVVSIPRGGDR